MPAHVHPDADSDGHVDAADLVDAVTERRAITWPYPSEGGRAYAHRVGRDEYFVLRLNRSHAFLDEMTFTEAQLLRSVRLGVDRHEESVEVGDVDDVWPARFDRGDRA